MAPMIAEYWEGYSLQYQYQCSIDESFKYRYYYYYYYNLMYNYNCQSLSTVQQLSCSSAVSLSLLRAALPLHSLFLVFMTVYSLFSPLQLTSLNS